MRPKQWLGVNDLAAEALVSSGVQQKLMRHAQISTTMNVYGNALMTAKREANSKMVRMALRSA